MPMSQTEMERRLTQQGADIDAIYEIVARVEAVQQQHSARFDGIDGRLDGIDGRLDGIDGRLDGIDGRLDGIDGRLDGIDGRLDELTAGVAELLRRLPD